MRQAVTPIGRDAPRWNATPRFFFCHALWACVAALIAGCASKPPEPVVVAPPPPPPPVVVAPPPPVAPPVFSSGPVSTAITPKAYRMDAASLLYAKYSDRIYKGKMPPLLYAIGVLDVEIDGRGQVVRIQWLRAPSQAPEVVKEIERMIRAASPLPAPLKMGRVVYTETWLWHKSGKFQLDTLSEGQY